MSGHLSEAADVLGKVMVYDGNDSNSEIYPLVSGEKLSFADRSVIKFAGGTLLADSGAVIEASENGGVMVFRIAKGDVSFKILPENIRVAFLTPQAELRTPQVVKTSSNMISGVLMVNTTTVVKVIEGEMDAVTMSGIRVIKAGEAFVLSDREISQSDVQTSEPADTDTPADSSSSGAEEGSRMSEPDEVLEAMSELPVNLLELLGMIGSKGVAQTPLSPEGNVKVQKQDTTLKARLVDYAMIDSGESLPAGRDVKVVCISADRETNEEMVLVRPYDSFYPEKPEEKTLIEKTLRAKENLSPRGVSEFAEYVQGRSNSGWNTVIVDANMQPDYTTGVAAGTELEVICVQSTLVLQPVEIVNEKYLNLVGKTVTSQSALEPEGQVALANADSNVMQAVLVDLNLGPVEGYSVPANTNLTIVGVKETPAGPVVLVQEPQNVLSEVNYAVGQTITSTYDISEFGLVNLNNNQWYAQVVGANFETSAATFPAGTVFKVVSVNTALLASTSTALIAMFAPAVVPVASLAGVGGAAVLTAGAVTGVALVPIIADDSGGDGGASEVEP